MTWSQRDGLMPAVATTSPKLGAGKGVVRCAGGARLSLGQGPPRGRRSSVRATSSNLACSLPCPLGSGRLLQTGVRTGPGGTMLVRLRTTDANGSSIDLGGRVEGESLSARQLAARVLARDFPVSSS
jgi:hypothetical protein